MNELFCELGGDPARCLSALLCARVMLSGMLAILFLQSGIDKIVDRRGNLEWLTGHFAKSPLRGVVPLMLSAITFLEVAAGAISLLGAATVLMGSRTFGLLGTLLSGLCLLCLFFGQRLAKDYAGAQGLMSYFAVVLLGVWLYLA